MSEVAIAEPNMTLAAGGRAGRIWIAALAAFLIGAGAAGWLGWRSGADFGHLLGLPHHLVTPVAAPAVLPTAASPASIRAEQDETALSARIAALEQRLDQIDLRTQAASGNAARAEALLVAFAVRRVVERGAPLGYLGDQLKLRFGDAQPNAVATIIADSKDLVPLDQLSARLEAMAPQLTDTAREGLWARVTREMAQVFVIRRDRPVLPDAQARLDDARTALSSGRVDDAIAALQHLPQSSDAVIWAAAARRYRDVERALDLIDTTALLEPHQLHDAVGNPVSQTGPLAAAPTPTSSQ